ncbi:MAG TPA: SagB family peptide dehydrogenase [Pseudonocardiaceae bacterium]|nr:SagB family peptide dehydrogenase [Pseudonocardiaceae bacterium]
MSTPSGDRRPDWVRLWSLRENVLVESEPDTDQIVVVDRWGETRVDGVPEVVRESLRRMSFGPVHLENVVAAEGSAEEAGLWAELRRVLGVLSASVVHSLGSPDAEGPLLSAVPVHRDASFDARAVDRRRPLRLSRFAAMRTHEGTPRLESPLARYHVVLHRPFAAQVVASLGTAGSIDHVAGLVGAPSDDVAAVAAYLVATGMVLVGDWAADSGEALFAEDSDEALMLWSHHDLMFHGHSRMGRADESGAVYPYAGRLPAPPLVRPAPDGRRLALYRPTQARVASHDPPLTAVMDRPKPVRALVAGKITAEQVGELLFRAARIRAVASVSTGTGVRYEVSDRPYLSVHGLYELELYVVANQCAGLRRAAYHYDPRRHELSLVNDSGQELDALLDEARVAARTDFRSAVLITITVRVHRSSWMYNGIGYSLALTHVGALQQTLCLVATAMGLSWSVPAIDPADHVDSVLRLDWPAEVGVGEFVLG